MIQSLILTIVFISLSSIFQSIKRLVSYRYDETVFAKMPQKWQGWLDPRLSGENANAYPEPLRTLFRTILLPATDLFQLANFLQYISTVASGMFLFSLVFTQSVNWFLALFAAYVLHFVVFNWFYLHVFVSKNKIVAQKTRGISGTPVVSQGIGKNIFSGVWNIWKSIAVMGGLTSVVLSVLWIGRTIDGRGGELLHQIPQSAGWPEIAAIATAGAIILFFVISTLVKLGK